MSQRPLTVYGAVPQLGRPYARALAPACVAAALLAWSPGVEAACPPQSFGSDVLIAADTIGCGDTAVTGNLTVQAGATLRVQEEHTITVTGDATFSGGGAGRGGRAQATFTLDGAGGSDLLAAPAWVPDRPVGDLLGGQASQPVDRDSPLLCAGACSLPTRWSPATPPHGGGHRRRRR